MCRLVRHAAARYRATYQPPARQSVTSPLSRRPFFSCAFSFSDLDDLFAVDPAKAEAGAKRRKPNPSKGKGKAPAPTPEEPVGPAADAEPPVEVEIDDDDLTGSAMGKQPLQKGCPPSFARPVSHVGGTFLGGSNVGVRLRSPARCVGHRQALGGARVAGSPASPVNVDACWLVRVLAGYANRPTI